MRILWLIFLFAQYCLLSSQPYPFNQIPITFENEVQKINVISQSTDGIIWIGTDKGLYSFDGKNTHLHHRPDKLNESVTTLTAGQHHQIWAGYADGNILVTDFSNQQHRWITPHSEEATAITKILITSDDEIFITTYGAGIWKMTDSIFHSIPIPHQRVPTDIYDAILDKNNNIWLATDDGIRILTPATGVVRSIMPAQGLADKIVVKLQQTAGDQIMIGLYDQGVQLYNTATNTFVHHFTTPVTSGNLISLLPVNERMNLFGYEKMMYENKREATDHTIQLPATLSEKMTATFFDKDQNIWIAAGRQLFIANIQISISAPGLSHIQTILPADQTLWYGCADGLYSSNREGTVIKKHLAKEKINVLSLFEDTQHNLWIGTFGQGVYIYHPQQNRHIRITLNDGLPNTSILNMDGAGNKVWLATLGGIAEIQWRKSPFDGSLSVSDFRDRFQFPPEYVYDVHVDDETVWFATDGAGICQLQNDQLRIIPIVYQDANGDSFQVKTCYSVVPDEDDNLWISSIRGSRFHITAEGKILRQSFSSQQFLQSLIRDGNGDIIAFWENEMYNVTNDVSLFDSKWLARSVSFTPNLNAGARDTDGTLWVADQKNIFHYTPDESSQHDTISLIFQSVLPAGKKDSDGIVLRPDSSFLDVRFVGLWFQNPGNVQYRYQLIGHDPGWIYTRENRAVYSRLSPGTYRFKVQASRSDSFLHASEIFLDVEVLPPFYLRWWFALSVLLAAGGSLFVLYKNRIRRMQRWHDLEKEKTTLQLAAIQAQVNPHFLFNSFNALSGIIEEDQKAAVDYVDQLSAFFRGALMHREEEMIPIAKEMEIVRNFSYILKKRYGDNISIEEEKLHSSGWIAPLSIQMLVENAIKHNVISSEKPLRIHIRIDHEWVTVRNPMQLKFQPGTESTGFGLSSLQTRYTYLTTRKVEIIHTAAQFIVKVPILYPDKAT